MKQTKSNVQLETSKGITIQECWAVFISITKSKEFMTQLEEEKENELEVLSKSMMNFRNIYYEDEKKNKKDSN